MSIRVGLRIVIFLAGSMVLLMIYYSKNNERQRVGISHFLDFPGILSKTTFDTRTGFAISNPQCKMLDPNPWNETIQKYLVEPRPLICSRIPLLTYIDQQDDFVNVLKVNKKVVQKYKGRSQGVKCCYQVITRINQNVQNYNMSADSLYELSECANFTDEVQLPNDVEFILVKCHSYNGKKTGKEVYRDVHAVVPMLPTVRLKINKSRESEIDETNERKTNRKRLNVIILGIDSVSKLNLRRIMPRTLKYLQQNGWLELNGYNKIGENTFPNLMAILSGEPMQTLEELCLANHSKKMDDCPSVWKDFNGKGYVTLYAEDTPAISTFNLGRTGFVEKPTDYYMRPFMQAAHDLLRLKTLNGLPVCLGPVLIVDHILNYAKRFFRAFNTSSYFSLLWLNSLSHNDLNAPRTLDVSVHKFLTDLSALGTYDNSLILLLSDHGVRFGDIRETFMGYLEERLPFMLIWLPTWFRERYPDRYGNLLVNQNRLTSPFDVYVTIKKLLHEDDDGASKYTSSACPKCNGLFEVQPVDRTCPDASIDVNWCLCSEFRDVSVKDATAVQVGTFLYKFVVNQTNELINRENVKKSLCSKWKFIKIFRTQEIVVPTTEHQYSLRNSSNSEIKRFNRQYITEDTKIFVTIIELNPGRTKFEATVLMQTNSSSENPSFAFLEPPKRLDSIYKTSKCVDAIMLKHYCYCVRR